MAEHGAACTERDIDNLQRRLTVLELQVDGLDHIDLTPEIVAWLKDLASTGARSGMVDLFTGHHYAPRLTWAIYPDGKLFLQLCDYNAAPVWSRMLRGAGTPGRPADGA